MVVEAIAEILGSAYSLDIPKLKNAALLHDIGKILVPDHILNKESSLSEDEWQIMRQHPREGKRFLQGTVFDDLSDWILYHHERIDGKGYYGLKGKDIPLEARIIAVADTFSALRTYRAYRPARSIDDTIAIIRAAAGTQLDVDVVNIFLSMDKNVLENLQCNCEICARRRKELEQI